MLTFHHISKLETKKKERNSHIHRLVQVIPSFHQHSKSSKKNIFISLYADDLLSQNYIKWNTGRYRIINSMEFGDAWCFSIFNGK